MDNVADTFVLHTHTHTLAGHFLYKGFQSSTDALTTIASTSIGDSYCAISFSYSASSSVELQLYVDGLGSIWSSLTHRVGDIVDAGWLYEAVVIDLESVSLMSSRRLAIQGKVILGEDGGEDAAADVTAYAALDGITLHPCTDCNSSGE